METILIQELPRLSEVMARDEFRELLCYAFVCKEHIYATDAFVLVRLNTSEHFTKEFIDKIPKGGLFFDRYLCHALNQKNIKECFLLEVKDDLLMNIIYSYGKSIYFMVKKSDQLYNLPTKFEGKGWYDKVIPKNAEGKERVAVDSIRIKGTLAAKLQKALGDDTGLHLYFFGRDNAIFVEPASFELKMAGRIGILMPMMIND